MHTGSMHRRSFLKSASLATVAGLSVSACGGGGGENGSAFTADSLPDPNAEQNLFVQLASLEVLTGQGRWLAFGASNADQSPIAADTTVQVYLRTIAATAEDSEVVVGPLDATFSPPAATGLPVYFVQTDLEEEGVFEIVAVAGEDFGTGAIQVVDPTNSRVVSADGETLVPGAMAVSVPTPTTTDDLGVFSICTQDPPCGMHEMSLDEALETGRPVALMFATPQFCQTAVCGPSVATLDDLRTGGDWGDTIFIHSEIFAEEPSGTEVATTPTTPAVSAWGLPTEPWLFTVQGDGNIMERLDGPMPQEILQTMLQNLTA